MAYLDLDELPELFDGHPLWSARARRSPGSAAPTTSAIAARRCAWPSRELVRERTGIAPDGPIRLLTHLRFLGHCFNPVSSTTASTPPGVTCAPVVAEVTNTPWGERHAYVLGVDEPHPHAEPAPGACSAASSRRRCTSRR